MQSPPNPHDAFFREVFSQPRHVVELLRLALPARLRAQLDLDPARVRVLSPTYVDATLRGTASDVVVEVPRRGPRTPGRRTCRRLSRWWSTTGGGGGPRRRGSRT
jgi:hypothetical protein